MWTQFIFNGQRRTINYRHVKQYMIDSLCLATLDIFCSRIVAQSANRLQINMKQVCKQFFMNFWVLFILKLQILTV